jgi:magnesium-transporting ATPase (P-type)
MLLHLALCHTIVIDERTGKYNASSPDELALVNAAKFFGAEFVKRDEENNMIINFEGKKLSYRLMNILEFNSTRKRMSVILEDPQGEYILLTKGADSIIKERLNMQASPFFRDSQIQVDAFAEEGLRTLFLAKRKLSKKEYLEWNAKFEAAMQTISNRDEEVARVNEEIEVRLELVGSTAIEDKLQDGVRKNELSHEYSGYNQVHQRCRRQGVGPHRRQGRDCHQHRLLICSSRQHDGVVPLNTE